MNLRSLEARIRKLEKTHGKNTIQDYFAGLSDKELEAGVRADDTLDSGRNDAREQAIQCVMDILEVNHKLAVSFLSYWGALGGASTGCQRMSDAELVAEIARLDSSIKCLLAARECDMVAANSDI